MPSIIMLAITGLPDFGTVTHAMWSISPYSGPISCASLVGSCPFIALPPPATPRA